MEQEQQHPGIPPKRNRRRQVIINTTFQWKMAGVLCVGVFLLSILLSCVLYGVLHQQARMRAVQPETYTASVTGVMLFFGIAFGVISAAAVGLWSLTMTHRICGPLFVLERHFVELGRGRFPNTRRLRSRDEFKAFYASFVRAVDAMKATKRAELHAINEALNELRVCRLADESSVRDCIRAVGVHLTTLQKATAESLGEALPSPPTKPKAEKKLEPATVGTA